MGIGWTLFDEITCFFSLQKYFKDNFAEKVLQNSICLTF